MRDIPVYILLIGLLLVSCQPDTTCRTEDLTHFRSQVVIDSIVVDSISKNADTIQLNKNLSLKINGIGSDSMLYNGNASVGQIVLPLHVDTTMSFFAISICGVADTLRIYHQNNAHFISLACGCFVYHTIDSIHTTHHGISEIRLLNSSIENTKEDNAIIYLHLK